MNTDEKNKTKPLKTKNPGKKMEFKTKSHDKRTDEKKQTVELPKDDKYSSEFLRQKLRQYFHHSDFKSTLQKDAIKEIMKGDK